MTTQALVKNEEKSIEFVPFGQVDKIKLSVSLIQSFVAVKTKSGKTCDPQQAMKFLMLCQAQRLNPFAGDAYLIGYETRDGGVQYSLITAHQAFLKRAESSKEFDGMESGVIVRDKEGTELHELPGDFYDDQAFELVGAWARVHHKQHKFPTYRRGALKTYRKNYGLWAEPANHAMMLVKCIEADALRSTFPTLLGGLHTEGETITIDAEPVIDRTSRLVQQVDPPAITQGDPAPDPKQSPREPKSGKKTPQGELADKLAALETVTFSDFCRVGKEVWPAMPLDSINSVDDLSATHAKIIVAGFDGLVAEINKGKA